MAPSRTELPSGIRSRNPTSTAAYCAWRRSRARTSIRLPCAPLSPERLLTAISAIPCSYGRARCNVIGVLKLAPAGVAQVLGFLQGHRRTAGELLAGAGMSDD
jgi:hypothetical protein